jgi:hypothetical protein
MPTSSPAHKHRGFRVFRTPAGIEFSPPKDSDALFDALRITYPDGKSHFERVLSAVGDFVRQEGRDKDVDNTTQPPCGESAKKLKKSLKFSVPNEDVRGYGERVEELTVKCGGPGANKNGFKSMTNVWSSETGRRYQYRPRRPMTEEERTEYRNKRAAGVCAPCRKRKRKVKSPNFPRPSYWILVAVAHINSVHMRRKCRVLIRRQQSILQSSHPRRPRD